MTVAFEAEPEYHWTPKQRAIIDLPTEARCLVVADAGTGKTAVLIERLARIVDRGDAAPGSEVLVLSFTRAVVGEIKKRLRSRESAVALVAPTTFDSFATRLLAEIDPGGEWIDKGFDGRIAAAVDLLDNGDEGPSVIARYRHVFIDEIQDLVGIRAELVERILRHCRGGFTLLGDPAQAIYDYQISSPEISVFDAVRLWYPDDLTELSLDENHRAETDLTRRVLAIGAPLSGRDPDYPAIGAALLDLAEALKDLGSVDRAATALRRVRASTAILCRDNGHALLLSERLYRLDVEHRLQRSASDRAIAPWVGRAFRSVKHLQTGRNAAERLLETEVESAIDPVEGWKLLKGLDRSPGNQLDLHRVRRAIAVGIVPDRLTARPDSDLVISTIHRAKGLEFEAVILLRTNDRLDTFLEEDDADLALGTRVLYVAMSRPRRLLMNLSGEAGSRIGLDRATRRWYRRGPQAWQTFGFEVTVDDVDRSRPPGSPPLGGRDVPAIQDYLWSAVHPGDAVELRFLKETVAGEIRATYEIIHDGRSIGVTSPGFGGLLHQRLHGAKSKGKWPQAITGIRVEGVETVAGPAAAGVNNGLGEAGLWLRPRLIGLGEFEW